jgi:hypothetical protein
MGPLKIYLETICAMSMTLLCSMPMMRLMTSSKSFVHKMCVDVDDPNLSSSSHMWKEQYCGKLLPSLKAPFVVQN